MVGIDAAKHAVVGANLQIMTERMTGQCCVVGFNIALEILLQTPILQKSDGCGGIVVILVLGRFHRLGFDKEGSLESDAASIVPGHGQEACKMLLLALHIGVEQAHITLTTTPEHVV
ncbi:hypothetical protein DSECCO2_538210 [anaerobic digester metagenome]